MAGEIREPGRNLPRAMFFAALLVTVIYILLNIVFIMASPGDMIISQGKYTIGALTAQNLLGNNLGNVFNISIIVILLSSVSVQIMIGPRVTYAMAKDRVIFSSLGRVSGRFMTPDLAIIIQVFISIFYVFIGFDAILKMLIYMGFALNVFPLLAVIGMVYKRIREPEVERPFRVPFFPVVPVLYIVLSLMIMTATLITRTVPSLFALGMVAMGAVVYYLWKRFSSG